ncbi:hypothetical protein RHMOL_Rhmol12G0172000 [Rhododendron molle]|uniref:Uncharacterized protein n=1 Tax=Rhododendron molle TaxID=49168 RepID=A0ACC0LKI4_RHOML|nr:hypothetical protein RHMOL_Rhmol12G0172000 [Rhododendron molle]
MAENDSDSPLSPNHIPPPENSPSKRPKTLTLSRAPSSPPPHELACDGSDTEWQSCGICLCSEEGGRAIIRGRIDSCDHYFCFVCIMEWAKVESRCPLCKRRFTSIRRPPMDGVFLNERVVSVPVRDQVYHCFGNATVGPPHPYSEVRCTVCNSEGDENFLLLCDLCDAASHTYCVGLGATVPEGDWFCNDCTVSKAEHEKSETDAHLDAPLSFKSLGERPLVEEHASILAIRREPRLRVLERPPTRVPAHPNNLSTPIPSERRTNPELGARTLRRCRNVQSRIQELRENWNAFRRGSLSFTSKSSDTADDTKLRKSSGATSSGRPSQPHRSGNNVSEGGSYDVVKAWKMFDAAKSVEQVRGKTSINLKSSKDNLSKVNNPVGKTKPSSSPLASSSKSLRVKDLAKSRSQKHSKCYSSVTGTESHKPQIDARERHSIATPTRILKYNEISPSSQSPGDYIPTSVLVNVCHGNGGKATEERLRAQSADGLHEHEGSGCLVSPAGSVTSGSNSTSAKLEMSLSSYMGIPIEKARMGKSCAGSNSMRDDDAKSEIQSLVKLNLKLLTRDRPIGVDAFKEIARLSTHSILAASEEGSNGLMTRIEEGSNCYEIINGCAAHGGGLKDQKIAAVHKIPWSAPNGRLEAFRVSSAQMVNKCRGNGNIKHAWYGGSRDELCEIISHGFHRCRQSGNDEDGFGVYLSPLEFVMDRLLSLPVDEYGLQYILLCSVILGKMEEVRSSSTQFKPSSSELVSFKILNSRGFGRDQTPVYKSSTQCVGFSVLIPKLANVLPPLKMALIRKYQSMFCQPEGRSRYSASADTE